MQIIQLNIKKAQIGFMKNMMEKRMKKIKVICIIGNTHADFSRFYEENFQYKVNKVYKNNKKY